jgi:glutamate dehydrogenase (NADP+)
MVNIFNACKCNAEKYGCAENYVAGANLAAFEKLAEAMKCQGVV